MYKERLLIISLLSCGMLTDCQYYQKKKNEPTVKQNVSEDVAITPLPFGPESLLTYKFPKNGWSNGGSEAIYGEQNPDSVYEKKLGQINSTFLKINLAKTIPAPIIKKVEYIDIEDDSLITKHYPNFRNDFKFRFPDLGPYQCFFQFHYKFKANLIVTKDNKTFSSYGNIILYDPRTQSAKILNVSNFFNYSDEDFGGSKRVFFIDKKGTIYLFKEPITEDTDAVIKLQKVTISKDGGVIIEKLN